MHEHGAAAAVDVAEVEADEFRDAQRRRVEQLGDRDVAHRDRITARRPCREARERVVERRLRRPRAAGCAAREVPSAARPGRARGSPRRVSHAVNPRADAARRAMLARARPRSVATHSQSRSSGEVDALAPSSMPRCSAKDEQIDEVGAVGGDGVRASTRARSRRARGSHRAPRRGSRLQLAPSTRPGDGAPRAARRGSGDSGARACARTVRVARRARAPRSRRGTPRRAP